jgi:protein O-mannosyl-transferase
MFNKINISSRRQKLIVYVILTLATLAVYWQVKHYGFINFDDPFYVAENYRVQSGMSLDGIRWAFSTKYFGLWNPLIWLSFMFDYQLNGLNAGGYHLTNLILHILSTLLLFWLFNRMTGEIWKSAFVAALFALHPLHVESVAWIAERKDVLSTFFWMLTLCLYVYYTEKPVIRRYLLILLFFTCALMSKPMVVTLPVVMILLDYWPLGRLQSRTIATKLTEVIPVSPNTNKGEKKTNAEKEVPKQNISPAVDRKSPEARIAGIVPLWQVYEKMPFFVLSAVFSIILLYSPVEPATSLKVFPLGSRLANVPVAFVTYLEKTFWPHDMAILYPFSDQLPLWQVLGATLLIIVISALIIAAAKRLPYLFVGWLWFAITIAPVIGILQISLKAPYSMADRYHYLPSIGLAVMMAWGIPLLFKHEDLRKKILFPVATAFIAFLMFLTWMQCGYWENSTILFGHALQVTKNNYIAHHNLATALSDEGKNKVAIYYYNEAIRLKPDYDETYYNRGNAYSKLGEYQLAIEDFNKAISLKKDHVNAYNNRGVIYDILGQYQLAIEDFNKVILLKEDFVAAYYNRGNAYFNRGNKELGCYDAQKACALGNCKLLETAKSKGYCR